MMIPLGVLAEIQAGDEGALTVHCSDVVPRHTWSAHDLLFPAIETTFVWCSHTFVNASSLV